MERNGQTILGAGESKSKSARLDTGLLILRIRPPLPGDDGFS